MFAAVPAEHVTKEGGRQGEGKTLVPHYVYGPCVRCVCVPVPFHQSACSTLAPHPPPQKVDVILSGIKELLEESSTSSTSPFDKESSSSSQLPPKNSLQGEMHFPPGFQLDLICTVMYQDAASACPSPATINSVEFSSKFDL